MKTAVPRSQVFGWQVFGQVFGQVGQVPPDTRARVSGQLPQTSVPICVLGCRPGSAALARRARAARDAFFAQGAAASMIITCGGMCGGRVEADELARMLKDGGVKEDAIIRERTSRDTHENATHAARILHAHGITDVILVTCTWHLPRATKLFTGVGLRVVQGVGAPPPNPKLVSRVWWAARERVSMWKDQLRHRPSLHADHAFVPSREKAP